MDFWTRVTYQLNNPDIISKIYSPDFDKLLYDIDDFENLEQPLIINDISSFINMELIKLIKERNGFVIAKTYNQIGIDFTNKQQFWRYDEINFSPDLKLFSRIIPIIGKVTTTFTIFTEMLITFMELRISSSSDNENNPMMLYLISLFGAFFNAYIALFLYTKTDVDEDLQLIGHEIDSAISKCFNLGCIKPINPICVHSSIYSKMLLTLAVTCVMLNSAINFAAERQSLILVAKEFLNDESYLGDTAQELIFTAIYINLIASLYEAITSQGMVVVNSLEMIPSIKTCTSNIQQKCSALLFNFRRPYVSNDTLETTSQQIQRTPLYIQYSA